MGLGRDMLGTWVTFIGLGSLRRRVKSFSTIFSALARRIFQRRIITVSYVATILDAIYQVNRSEFASAHKAETRPFKGFHRSLHDE